jgi:hypothetical protein
MPLYKKGDILTVTLTTGDSANRLVEDPEVKFEDVNIHIYSNDAYYGNGPQVGYATQGAATPNCSIARANDVLLFRHLYAHTLFFKSQTNGSAAVIVASGTLE